MNGKNIGAWCLISYNSVFFFFFFGHVSYVFNAWIFLFIDVHQFHPLEWSDLGVFFFFFFFLVGIKDRKELPYGMHATTFFLFNTSKKLSVVLHLHATTPLETSNVFPLWYWDTKQKRMNNFNNQHQFPKSHNFLKFYCL